MKPGRRELRPVIEWLEAQKRVGEAWAVDARQLKPCVAVLVEQGIDGTNLDATLAAIIISSELRKLQKPRDQALRVCLRWAVDTAVAFKTQRKLEGRVVAAYERDEPYDYGCGLDGPLYQSGLCIGHEACPYYKALGGKREPEEWDFCEYGWPLLLSGSACRIYLALMAREAQKRAVGGTSFVSFRQLERWSGVRRRRVREGLEELAGHGLIQVIVGSKGGQHKRATEITRTQPIPEPKRAIPSS